MDCSNTEMLTFQVSKVSGGTLSAIKQLKQATAPSTLSQHSLGNGWNIMVTEMFFPGLCFTVWQVPQSCAPGPAGLTVPPNV